MASLPEAPHVNPHATLITLFMNAVDENMTDLDRFAGLNPESESTRSLRQYLPDKSHVSGRYNPEIIKVTSAREIIGNYDHIFDR